ncbi:hypothetical protein DNTS_013795 [Danionella cerebrum]|uniref:Uncharacterized protein n=1 Tax=Danionella cerebrum TaxID=2873325 RepID=A0A553QPT5_9TELE|nr:hypothetical protein DNTS_013795 [Danionella translucida]
MQSLSDRRAVPQTHTVVQLQIASNGLKIVFAGPGRRRTLQATGSDLLALRSLVDHDELLELVLKLLEKEPRLK